MHSKDEARNDTSQDRDLSEGEREMKIGNSLQKKKSMVFAEEPSPLKPLHDLFKGHLFWAPSYINHGHHPPLDGHTHVRCHYEVDFVMACQKKKHNCCSNRGCLSANGGLTFQV